MDAFELLMQDHRRVEDIIQKILAAKDPDEKMNLFDELVRELTIHTRLEEAILYPAMEEHEELAALIKDAVDEHTTVDSLAAELTDADEPDDEWAHRVGNLRDLLTHHIGDEEQELFPKARELFSKDELLALGEKMLEKRHELARLYDDEEGD